MSGHTVQSIKSGQNKISINLLLASYYKYPSYYLYALFVFLIDHIVIFYYIFYYSSNYT